MIEIMEVKQGSHEWHHARAGVVTASMFAETRKRMKSGPNKGDFSQAAKDYAFRLAIERISGEPLADEQFTTYAMKRGNELEPDARRAHEKKAALLVKKAGFVRTLDGRFGASADGLINQDGGSEYKCLVDPARIAQVILGHNIDEFKDQVQGGLWLTGRDWWHFCLYCPALKPAAKDLIIFEVRRDDDYIAALEADLIAFDRLVETYRTQLIDAPVFHAAA